MSSEDLKVVIFVDMEGISGINNHDQVSFGKKEYEETGRVFLTEDVNAAIRGLRAEGATEIGIFNFHGVANEHLIPEKLEKGVKILGPPSMAGFNAFLPKSIAAGVLIGHHAMAGTKDGFLSHTVTAGPIYKINEKPVGETNIIAMILSHFQIPVIMVTGDQALVKEALEILPGIEAIQVKTSTDRRTTECLPVEEARKLIEEAAARALSRREKFKPLEVEKPIKAEAWYPIPMQTAYNETIPRSEKINENSVSYIAENPLEAIKFFFSTMMISSNVGYGALLMELNKNEEARKIIENYWDKQTEEWLAQ